MVNVAILRRGGDIHTMHGCMIHDCIIVLCILSLVAKIETCDRRLLRVAVPDVISRVPKTLCDFTH